MTKVFIASDHAGVEVKALVDVILSSLDLDLEVIDLGPSTSEKAVDYPDYAQVVCEEIQDCDDEAFGVLICGSGTGMQIAANKFDGIRAAFCYDKYSAIKARQDNDANVLTLRAREFDENKYEEIITKFFTTSFSGDERHINRIEKIFDIEEFGDGVE